MLLVSARVGVCPAAKRAPTIREGFLRPLGHAHFTRQGGRKEDPAEARLESVAADDATKPVGLRGLELDESLLELAKQDYSMVSSGAGGVLLLLTGTGWRRGKRGPMAFSFRG